MSTRSRKRSRSTNYSSDSYAETVETYQTGYLEYQPSVNLFRNKKENPLYVDHKTGYLESHPEASNSQPKTMPDSPISTDNQTTPSYAITTGGKESHQRDKPAKKVRGLVPMRLNFSDEVIKVSLDGKDGEYVLKLTTGDKKENAMEEQAQAAAMLLSQAAMLRGLGETLLSNLQAQFEPQFFKSLNMKEPTE